MSLNGFVDSQMDFWHLFLYLASSRFFRVFQHLYLFQKGTHSSLGFNHFWGGSPRVDYPPSNNSNHLPSAFPLRLWCPSLSFPSTTQSPQGWWKVTGWWEVGEETSWWRAEKRGKNYPSKLDENNNCKKYSKYSHHEDLHIKSDQYPPGN